jgi:hypothetical protein
VVRALLANETVTFHGEYVHLDAIKVQPKPAHPIPIWVGGSGPRARRRAIELGDGYHLISVTPEQAVAPIAEVRASRPEPEFVVSLRTGWDPQGMEHDRIRAEYDAYAEAGIDYVVCAPWRTDLDDWLRSMDLLAELTGVEPA